MTDKTVSACCGAEVETRYSSFIDGNQYTCTKCRLVNCDVVERPTPTTPPTETVSECCGAETLFHDSLSMDKRHYTCTKCHQVCGNIAPTRPTTILTKEMIERAAKYSNEKQAELVEPTVDKWEEDYKKLFIDIWLSSTTIGVEEGDRLLSFIRTIIAHSVQEAKAERAREIAVRVESALFYGDNDPKILRNHLTDLLASLKQEEEV